MIRRRSLQRKRPFGECADRPSGIAPRRGILCAPTQWGAGYQCMERVGGGHNRPTRPADRAARP